VGISIILSSLKSLQFIEISIYTHPAITILHMLLIFAQKQQVRVKLLVLFHILVLVMCKYEKHF